jgi:hypothetical protein
MRFIPRLWATSVSLVPLRQGVYTTASEKRKEVFAP